MFEQVKVFFTSQCDDLKSLSSVCTQAPFPQRENVRWAELRSGRHWLHLQLGYRVFILFHTFPSTLLNLLRHQFPPLTSGFFVCVHRVSHEGPRGWDQAADPGICHFFIQQCRRTDPRRYGLSLQVKAWDFTLLQIYFTYAKWGTVSHYLCCGMLVLFLDLLVCGRRTRTVGSLIRLLEMKANI